MSEADAPAIGVRQAWQEMAAGADDPFALYQSPAWFEVQRVRPPEAPAPHALAVCHDARQGLVGLVPLYAGCGRCVFPLVFGKLLMTPRREMIVLPSGHLLVPPGDHGLDDFFACIHAQHPGRPILKIENIPVPGPLWDYLHSSPRIRRDYFLHPLPGLDRIHLIPLPSSYEQYLEQYGAKKRYNLRRQFRLLKERAGEDLELRRYESSQDVPKFLTLWSALSDSDRDSAGMRVTQAKSWAKSEHYRRLADLGLLRCYILRDGERPIAGILGHLYGRTFMLGRTLYDPEYAAFSPGTALLHLVIEDLINSRAAGLINLGYGEPRFNCPTANVVRDYASYWLIPKSAKRRLFLAGYQALRGGVGWAKAAVRAAKQLTTARAESRSTSTGAASRRAERPAS
jgi:hypothetical protein